MDALIGGITRFLDLLIFFVLWYFRKSIYHLISNKLPNSQSNKMKRFLEKSFELCVIRYNKFLTSVFIPILLVSGLFLYFYLVNANINKQSIDLVSIVNSIMLAPLFEEILFRGLFLGLTITLFSYIYFKKLNQKINKISLFNVKIVGLLVVSVIFSIAHEGSLDIRYFGGIIFGLVYLIDKNNLLPSIIAHIFNNILVFVIYGY